MKRGSRILDVPFNGTYQRDYDAGLRLADSPRQCLLPGRAGVVSRNQVQTIYRTTTDIGQVTACLLKTSRKLSSEIV
jgi:hypothetical protein